MLKINGRSVGPGQPAYIVAEMSANHDGKLDKAVAILRAAKDAGADAVKLQTYTPETMTLDCDKPMFKISGTIWEGRKLFDLYKEAMTPWDWHPHLRKVATEIGIDLFSSPFDESAVAFLEKQEVPVYKIASFEIGDIPLLKSVAATRKPVIVSTGMANLDEIAEALETLEKASSGPVALLKCTSAYPAPPETMNLRAIPALAEKFGVPVGLSDHTLGGTISVAAVALGACIIEKHVTISRSEPGPDSSFSMEPGEFKAMVDAIRAAEKALGRPVFETAPHEVPSRAFRRSLFTVADIEEGATLTRENVRAIRPADGLHPRHFEDVLGRKAKKRIERGTPLAWELLE